MKKTFVLLVLFFAFFEYTSAQVTDQTQCTQAGGYCVSTWISDDDRCPSGQDDLGVCTGYLNNSACCKPRGGEVFPSGDACRAAGGDRGIGCAPSGQCATGTTQIGTCAIPTLPGVSNAATACCVSDGPVFRSEDACRTAGEESGGASCNLSSNECSSGTQRRIGTCFWGGSYSACCAEGAVQDLAVPDAVPYGDYKLLERIPGSANTSGQLQPYLESIYKAGFVLIVLGAVFMIGVGGFVYMSSAGNTAMISKGKGMIKDALIGLIVALFVWLILDIINPDLVNLRIDPLPGVNFDPGNSGATIADQNSSAENERANQTGGSYTLTLRGGGTVQVRACNESALERISFLGHQVRMHRNLIPSLRRIDAQWRERGGNSFYRVTSVGEGGYSCRNAASGSGNRSNHAYGLAVDINPAQNPYDENNRGAPRTNMPPAFRQLFLSEGWGWGGNWVNSKDAMHFSKGRSEGGDMRGE